VKVPRKQRPEIVAALEELLSRLYKTVDMHARGVLGEMQQSPYKRDIFRLFREAYSKGWMHYHDALPILFTPGALVEEFHRRWPNSKRRPMSAILDRMMGMWSEWLYAWDHQDAGAITRARMFVRMRKLASGKARSKRAAGPPPSHLTKAECVQRAKDRKGMILSVPMHGEERHHGYLHIATNGLWMIFYCLELDHVRVERLNAEDKLVFEDQYRPE